MKDYKYNRLGGVDAIKNGKPYTLSESEIKNLPSNVKIKDFSIEEHNAKIDKSLEKKEERYNKLNAFDYKDVVCSVTKEDQNGWTSLISRLSYMEDNMFPVNFENYNGNIVKIQDKEELDEFLCLAWESRDSFFK